MTGKDSKEREAPKALSYDAIKRFKTDAAGYLVEAINEFVETSPFNWAAPFNHPLFKSPVAIAFGDGDAKDFLDAKKQYPWTLSPREWLELAVNAPMPPMERDCLTPSGDKFEERNPPMMLPEYHPDRTVTWPQGEPPLPPWPIQPFIATAIGESLPKLENVSVISIALPMWPTTVEAECDLEKWHFCGSPEFTLNSRVGGHGGFIMMLGYYIERLLQYMGHTTAVPYLCWHWGMRYVQQQFQYAGPTSRTPVTPCPDRIWAVASGLGTYGLNDMVLTEVGMATNLLTIITDAKIQPSPKPNFEYCLYYRDKSCSKCVDVCPVGAIYTETPGSGLPGRLPGKCHMSAEAMVQYKKKYLVDQTKEAFGPWYEGCNMNYAAGGGIGGSIGEYSTCGQCQCNVPCAMGIPESADKKVRP